MSQITTRDILKGGFFTITTRDGRRFCYQVEHVPAKGRGYASWYVRYVTDVENFYVGYYDRQFGTIKLSSASKFAQEDERFRVVFRVFLAIFNEQYNRMTAHGDSIRKGTPNDQHEETPTSVPVSNDTPRTVKTGTLYHMDYDIHGQAYTMDYDTLYRRSIQTSESCYYFEASQIPWKMIDEMNASGCTVNLVRTHDDEIERLLKLAEQQMAKKMAAKEESLQQSLANAAADYESDLADDTISAEKARKRYDSRIKSAIRAAEKLAEQYQEAAKNYGLRLNLNSLRAASQSMQAKAAAQAASYVKAASKVTGAMATVAANGDLPAVVLADVLTEQGDEEAAQQFQSEFFDLESGEDA